MSKIEKKRKKTFLHLWNTAVGCVDVCQQYEPLKMRLAEQRLHNDIQTELRDFNDLERQLVHSLEKIHARKRQLEIKRSRVAA